MNLFRKLTLEYSCKNLGIVFHSTTQLSKRNSKLVEFEFY